MDIISYYILDDDCELNNDTGDVGERQPNGAMKIIDRKKNIFMLSQNILKILKH